MTDWDKSYLASSKQAGNWYPDDEPLDRFDHISLVLAYFCGAVAALASLAALAGYFWETMT